MKAIRLLILTIGIVLLSISQPSTASVSTAQAATPSQASNLAGVEATWDPQLGTPSFLRGPMPLPAHVRSADMDQAAVALSFLADYGAVLGIQDLQRELVASQVTTDALGFSHVTLQQVYEGVTVYNAQVKLHINQATAEVVALSNGFVPDLALSTVQPQVAAEKVRAAVQQLLPHATVPQPPTLTVYPGTGSDRAAAGARLAWLVEAIDYTQPAHNLYLFDATTGELLDVLSRLYTTAPLQPTDITRIPTTVAPDEPRQTVATRLATYDAQNTEEAPGTLVRIDDQPPIGDTDADNAHHFADVVYHYYQTVHQRNSYDDQGAVISSTVHFGENMQNAFWTGEQMIYGDGFPALDVVGHELTHGVTYNTANLEYRWQSGALNESFSDIFGAMVDREDWLLGEDLADVLGQEAIRDMANPERFGQPSHTDKWLKTCSDEEGVHINSGIFNKAYYMIVNAIGDAKAEQIFYRTLVTYLTPTSSFADARAAVLQATDDLYTTAENTAEHDAIVTAFNGVGLTINWQPPVNDCDCSIDNSLDQPAAAAISQPLYQVRDTLLTTTPIGRYYKDLYYAHTAQISLLLLANPELRAQAADLLHTFEPGFQQLVAKTGDPVVLTDQMVNELRAFLAALTQMAETLGQHDLAQTLSREQARIAWEQLPGLSFAEAWAYLNALDGPYTIYLPNIRQ